MPFFEMYPNTDFSQINLDMLTRWTQHIMKEITKLSARVQELEQHPPGGTSDYDDLTDKPQINSVTLQGNKSTSDLNIDADAVGAIEAPSLSGASAGWYLRLSPAMKWIAYPGNVNSVNGKTGSVTLDASDVGAVPEPASPSSGDVIMWNGVEWEATNIGTERTWTLLQTIDVAQHGSGSITINDIDNFTEFMCFGSKVKNNTSTQSGYTITVNGTDLSQSGVTIAKSTTDQYNWCYIFYDGMFWHVCHHQPTINNNYIAGGNLLVPYFFKENVGKCTTFKLSAPATTYQAVSGTIKIWGR